MHFLLHVVFSKHNIQLLYHLSNSVGIVLLVHLHCCMYVCTGASFASTYMYNFNVKYKDALLCNSYGTAQFNLDIRMRVLVQSLEKFVRACIRSS